MVRGCLPGSKGQPNHPLGRGRRDNGAGRFRTRRIRRPAGIQVSTSVPRQQRRRPRLGASGFPRFGPAVASMYAPKLTDVVSRPRHAACRRRTGTYGKSHYHAWLADKYGLQTGIHFDDGPDICTEFENRYSQDRCFRIYGGHHRRARHARHARVYSSFGDAVREILNRAHCE